MRAPLTPDTLRVATYNVHSGVGFDRRYDPQRTLQAIREIDPDILALQEVRAHSPEEDQFDLFREGLGMEGAFGPTFRRRRFRFGNAILVKGEILRSRTIDLTVPPFDARGAVEATVRVHGRTLRVVSTHLGLLSAERARQIARLGAALDLSGRVPTVVMGDFNVFGRERQALAQAGAPLRLPRVATFPSVRPLLPLDRLWTLPHSLLHDVHAHRTRTTRWASDHLPLVGALRLPPR